MTEVTNTDMANSALLLNEEVEKRIAASMLKVFLGEVETAEGVDCEKYLRMIIQQEIVNAFSDPNSSCTRTVVTGDTIHIKSHFTVS